jgi:hypothetical protein
MTSTWSAYCVLYCIVCTYEIIVTLLIKYYPFLIVGLFFFSEIFQVPPAFAFHDYDWVHGSHRTMPVPKWPLLLLLLLRCRHHDNNIICSYFLDDAIP